MSGYQRGFSKKNVISENFIKGFMEIATWIYGKCLMYVGKKGWEMNPDAEFIDGGWRFKSDWEIEMRWINIKKDV